MRQREFRVGGQRPIEQRLGPGIGRQHQIDRRDIIRDSRRRIRAQGQAEAIFKRHRVSSSPAHGPGLWPARG
jgi:hypothetical protein